MMAEVRREEESEPYRYCQNDPGVVFTLYWTVANKQYISKYKEALSVYPHSPYLCHTPIRTFQSGGCQVLWQQVQYRKSMV